MALLGIYTVLAGILGSYLQPIIIMVAIPFGQVGAVIGHWMLGFDVTLLSMFGMVVLAGILVNDALELLDLVNRKVRAGGRGVRLRRRSRPPAVSPDFPDDGDHRGRDDADPLRAVVPGTVPQADGRRNSRSDFRSRRC